MQVGSPLISINPGNSGNTLTQVVSPSVSQKTETTTIVDQTEKGGAKKQSTEYSNAQEEAFREEKVKQEKRRLQLQEDANVRQVVAKLAARDREVRAHEQAHAAVGGQYAGAPSYEYTKGPDGKQYAVGGEVSIDTSPIPGDPEATLEKARVIKAAALAPAEPSMQDKQVAQAAQQMAIDAQSEIIQMRAEERQAQTESMKEKTDTPSEEASSTDTEVKAYQEDRQEKITIDLYV